MKNNLDSLDFQIAQLNVMITEFIVRDHHCYTLAKEICKRITTICKHVEIEFFPQQQRVYLKMLNVWQAINHTSDGNRAPYSNSMNDLMPTTPESKITH